jgi:hypothetical protein
VANSNAAENVARALPPGAATTAAMTAGNQEVTGSVVSIIVETVTAAFTSATSRANGGGGGIFTSLASERRGDASFMLNLLLWSRRLPCELLRYRELWRSLWPSTSSELSR